jgi:hypothetical protein
MERMEDSAFLASDSSSAGDAEQTPPPKTKNKKKKDRASSGVEADRRGRLTLVYEWN